MSDACWELGWLLSWSAVSLSYPASSPHLRLLTPQEVTLHLLQIYWQHLYTGPCLRVWGAFNTNFMSIFCYMNYFAFQWNDNFAETTLVSGFLEEPNQGAEGSNLDHSMGTYLLHRAARERSHLSLEASVPEISHCLSLKKSALRQHARTLLSSEKQYPFQKLTPKASHQWDGVFSWKDVQPWQLGPKCCHSKAKSHQGNHKRTKTDKQALRDRKFTIYKDLYACRRFILSDHRVFRVLP